MAQEFKAEFTKYQSEMNHLLSGLDEQQSSGAEGGSQEEVDEASAAVEALSVAAAPEKEEKTADTATNEDKI